MRSFFLTIVLMLVSFTSLFAQDDLDNYISRLRKSAKEGGAETAFLSPGLEFIYGQDYFEAKNYFSAASSFKRVVDSQKDNPYANYQLAIALIRQNDQYKTQQAQEYLQNAFRLNPSLKQRYATDVPAVNQAAVRTTNTNGDALENYIEKLKYSRDTGGKETAMNTAGNSALYGIEYYERGEYESANMHFRMALGVDPDNAYVNYMLGIGLQAMRNKDGEIYLAKAFAKNPSLKTRYAKDASTATAMHNKYEESRKIKTMPREKDVFGGKLILGSYACNQVVYTGSKIGSPYDFVPKGSIELLANGTYRWLNNGGTGKYKYDAATGTITWLSGYFKNAQAKLTQFQPKGQITVNFTTDYRWECGCSK